MRIALSELLWIGFLCFVYLVSLIFPFGMIFIVLFIVLAALAYGEDKKREQAGRDDFQRDGLFYRYGAEISHEIVPVPSPADWQLEEIHMAINSLRQVLAERLRDRLRGDGAEVIEPAVVSNLDRSYAKAFAKVVARAPQGSLLVYFIHFAAFGNSIVVHYFAFSRGLVNQWRLFRFIIESPISIWFWGIPWLQNRFSILSSISRVEDDSYETLDLQTIHTTLSKLIFEALQDTLSEK